ncbi:hypothetical protein NDU88_005876 [Pleurodeles waltl]|uniref:Secreted protein n=1 Tax=Pleurodeles waltl TaxID=8319 RepID=A0AAV7RQK0_PLEWA|nr:hypothetical protein NDU88_005876 [Pleurodeles waltl]
MVAGTWSTPLRTILLCAWGRCRLGSWQKKLEVWRKGEQLLSDGSTSRATRTDDDFRNLGWVGPTSLATTRRPSCSSNSQFHS